MEKDRLYKDQAVAVCKVELWVRLDWCEVERELTDYKRRAWTNRLFATWKLITSEGSKNNSW